MTESMRAWRLSIVLRELQYPAQKWMIQTAADLYGADVQTQIELRDLPETTYHDIDDVVSAVENRGRRFVGALPRPARHPIGPRYLPHDVRKHRPRELALDIQYKR
jgi:hypothetical protein